MSKTYLLMFSLYLFCSPFLLMAKDFDGSTPLLGAVDRIIEINQFKIIDNVNPDTVGLPQKFIIDFKNKILRPTKDNVVRRTSKIKRVEHIENKLILQGAEEGVASANDGLGWTMSISKDTGKIVLSAVGEGIAYVVFGTCVSIEQNEE